MNTGTLMKLSGLVGLAAGCSHVLGMDENHPVLDCNKCPTGYQCDQTQVACVVIETGTSGGHGATNTSEAPSGGQGGSATSTTAVTKPLSGGAPTVGYASASGANANATTATGGSNSANGSSGGILTALGGETGPTGGKGAVTGGDAFSGGTPNGGGASSGGTPNGGGASSGGAPPGGTGTSTMTVSSGGASVGGTGTSGATATTLSLGGTANGGVTGAASAGTGSAECLTIKPSAGSLPDPCLGNHYDVGFFVEGGTGHYDWQKVSAPPGLDFANGHVLGTPQASEPGILSIRVVDTSNPQCTGSAQYTLTPRDKCWLAYISTDQGRAKLHLFDPVLQDYQSSVHRLTFPNSPGEGAPVSNFKFSPDGHYLAYQLNGSPARLMLLTAPAWQETPLTFQVDSAAGSVAYYAWSPDSSTLAVAFTVNNDAGSNTYLGGVYLSQNANPADAESGGAPPSIDYLDPIAAKVQSELVWIGNGRFVAYHAPSAGAEFPRLAELALAQNRFLSDIKLGGELPNGPLLNLVPTTNGFWAVDPLGMLVFWELPQQSGPVTWEDLFFYLHAALGSTDPIGQARDTVLAPSTRYAARKWPVDTPVDLRLYGPTDEDANSPLATAAGCPTFLAWSQQTDRMACVADTQTASVIRIYDLSSSTPPAVSESELPDDQYAYSENDAYTHRRALSASGNWFAFASANYVYIAALSSGSPRIVPDESTPMLGGTDHVNFAFSPDDRCLLEHRGTELRLHRLDYKNAYVIPVGYGLREPETCTPVFLDKPSNWCGNAGNSNDILWSPDSRWATFLTEAGDLRILDTSILPTFVLSQVNATTELACDSPAFQP